MGNKKKIAMTIAGSDPSGGAGIQTDLKAFAFLGLHGVSAITCITAQNTQHVEITYKLPVEIIESQIDVLLEDIKPDAVKTGMLYDKEIVESVAKRVKKYKMKVVVDPVMIATSGDSLSTKSFIGSIKNELIPQAYMLTPNIQEANALTGMKIANIDDIKKACNKLHGIGAEFVLIKGGHLPGEDVTDVLFDGKKYEIFSLPRIKDRYAHGSGCNLSALITGLLAIVDTPFVAVRKAKLMLWNMINKGYKPGRGADVLNYQPNMITDIPSVSLTREHFKVWLEVKTAIERLIPALDLDFIPEVGINIGYALPNAKKLEDICAINGRIVKTKDKPLRCGCIDFGVSKHVASIILTAMNFDSDKRCAINLKYSEGNISKCKKAGFKIGSFDRVYEPRNIKSTMEWGTRKSIKELGFVPDVIYDQGGKGKEAMIRILGRNPEDVVNKAFLLFKKI